MTLSIEDSGEGAGAMGSDGGGDSLHSHPARGRWPFGASLKCHFCDTELPEPGYTHIFYCSGTMKRVDGDAIYPTCIACRKRLRLKDEYLRRACAECGEPT